MKLNQQHIHAFNEDHHKAHDRAFAHTAEKVADIQYVLQRLQEFQVAIPSWALGTGGTRFGRFSGGGEPRSLEEKIEDVGLLHALNRASGAISLHIPWDIPENAPAVKALAAQHGLRFDAVNSNTFQDQPGQQHSYKFGSLHHTDKAVRKQAIAHNIEVVKYGIELGSNVLSLWLSDGSNFPGQLNFREAFQRTLESLQEILCSTAGRLEAVH